MTTVDDHPDQADVHRRSEQWCAESLCRTFGIPVDYAEQVAELVDVATRHNRIGP